MARCNSWFYFLLTALGYLLGSGHPPFFHSKNGFDPICLTCSCHDKIMYMAGPHISYTPCILNSNTPLDTQEFTEKQEGSNSLQSNQQALHVCPALHWVRGGG